MKYLRTFVLSAEKGRQSLDLPNLLAAYFAQATLKAIMDGPNLLPTYQLTASMQFPRTGHSCILY